jgi:hypothetical protein
VAFLIQRIKGDPGADLQRTTQMERLAVTRLSIGRGAAADLRLADPALDLVHAVIQPIADGGWEVLDRGSVTGTYVNGKRVERVPVGEGDWVELGRHRLTLQPPPAEGMALLVYVRELEEVIERDEVHTEGGGTVEAPRVEYLAAYGLARRGLKTSLSILCAVGALGVLAVLFDRHDVAAFRPGSVSQAHAGIANRCEACHRPWQGAVDSLCVECHAAPEHQPRQVAEPGCAECHTEHRFRGELARVSNGFCVDCHASVRLEDDGPPRFTSAITDFASDHPDFAVDVSTGEEGRVARVPLSTAVADAMDPTTLTFPHRKHLEPGLKSPQGPVELDCFSCHTPDRTGELRPVVFEQHCQSCHKLSFDAGRPEAPHGSSEVLHAFLLQQYAESAPPSRSLPEQRRLLPGRTRRSQPVLLDLDERVLRKVVETEYNLYRASCEVCHELDMEGVLPAVVPPAISGDWMPYALFSHEPHRVVGCTVCHGGVPDSGTAADVLLPDVETCRSCHGGREGIDGRGGGATTACIRCHAYHDASRTGDWGTDRPGGIWETGTGMGDDPTMSGR